MTAALLLVAAALAHGGHASELPWSACADASLGDTCSWDAHDVRYRGTCRRVSDALLCVRNQPLVPVADAGPSPLGVAAAVAGAGTAVGVGAWAALRRRRATGPTPVTARVEPP